MVGHALSNMVLHCESITGNEEMMIEDVMEEEKKGEKKKDDT